MADEPPVSGEESGKDKDKDKGKEEKKDVAKSGYGQEWKEDLGQKETGKTYTPGKGWEKSEKEAAEGGKPERKVTIVQHTWAEEKGYLGPSASAKGEGAYASGKAGIGIGYYKAEASSQISYDLNKLEANLTPIEAKVQVSLVHGEADGEFDVGSWLSGGVPKAEPAPPTTSATGGGSGFMAARVGDLTSHGSPLAPGIGSINVFIGGMPAWRTLMDFHACPIVKGVVPDVGGMVMVGATTVLINSMMACRVNDFVVEIPGGPNPIAMGCPTVQIGSGGGGGAGAPGAGGGGASEGKGGVKLTGKAEGDVLTAGAEAKLSAVANKDKILAEGKIGAFAAVAKGSIGGGLTIPLWGDHSISLGAGAEGSVLSAGADAHAGAGWTKEKGFQASVGAKAALGLGLGLNFTIGFK